MVLGMCVACAGEHSQDWKPSLTQPELPHREMEVGGDQAVLDLMVRT